MMSVSRICYSQLTGITVFPPSHRTDVIVKLCWIFCLMTCGSSWWAG